MVTATAVGDRCPRPNCGDRIIWHREVDEPPVPRCLSCGRDVASAVCPDSREVEAQAVEIAETEPTPAASAPLVDGQAQVEYTTVQAAAVAGVPRSPLYQALTNGFLPSRQTPDGRRIQSKDLTAWLSAYKPRRPRAATPVASEKTQVKVVENKPSIEPTLAPSEGWQPDEYTVAQAAKSVGVLPSTLYYAINAGRLACHRTPVGSWIRRADLEAWQAGRRSWLERPRSATPVASEPLSILVAPAANGAAAALPAPAANGEAAALADGYAAAVRRYADLHAAHVEAVRVERETAAALTAARREIVATRQSLDAVLNELLKQE